jgi:hypothetical protein
MTLRVTKATTWQATNKEPPLDIITERISPTTTTTIANSSSTSTPPLVLLLTAEILPQQPHYPHCNKKFCITVSIPHV